MEKSKSQSAVTSLFARVRSAAENKYARLGVLVSTPGLSFAQAATPPTLDSVLDTFTGSIMTGVGTTFAKIGPLLALVWGVALAWRWIKKGSSS